jgi:excisionase family DNA binding protein
MTRKEVAELLKATTRTVDRYIDSGKLASTKVEGKVLILKSSVDKLLEG